MVNFSFRPIAPAGVLTWLALFLLAFRLPAAAQGPVWQSAQAVAVASVAATTNAAVTAAAADAAGNIYLAGYFTNSVVLGTTTLTSLGSEDVFVAKFNPTTNQFVWAQRAGGTLNDEPTALAVSGTSVYVTGHYTSSTASFGPTVLTNTTANAGYFDVFVAKLTDAGPAGSFVWAQRAGGTGYDESTALAVSGTSVYVTGYYGSPTAGFGATTLANADNTGSSPDAFVAKLTDAGPAGSFVWAQRAGGTDFGVDAATGLAVSGTSVYVTGSYSSRAAHFGPIILANATVAGGNSDVFVAKLTDAGLTGRFVWAQRAGGTGSEYADKLFINGTNVYVAGDFETRAAGFGTTSLTSAGGYDVFVAKLVDAGPAGSFVWAQQAGGAGFDVATALTVSGTSVYVAGVFDSPTAGFGATTLANATTAGGTNDVFVTKLTDAGPAGRFVWAQRAGGTGSEKPNELVLNGSRLYVAGAFNGHTAGFGAITLSNPSFQGSLGFLAALTEATPTATEATAGPRPRADLFPNPARCMVTLRLSPSVVPTALTLTDALGRIVRNYPAAARGDVRLDLQGIPAGFYLLRGAGPARRLVVE